SFAPIVAQTIAAIAILLATAVALVLLVRFLWPILFESALSAAHAFKVAAMWLGSLLVLPVRYGALGAATLLFGAGKALLLLGRAILIGALVPLRFTALGIGTLALVAWGLTAFVLRAGARHIRASVVSLGPAP